jgi:hypothetical protein
MGACIITNRELLHCTPIARSFAPWLWLWQGVWTALETWLWAATTLTTRPTAAPSVACTASPPAASWMRF